jgi:transposase
VSFTHRRRNDTAELKTFFGSDVAFGAAADEVIFPTSIKQIAVVGADPYLNDVLIKYCEQAIAARSTNSSFELKVENLITLHLPHGAVPCTAARARRAEPAGHDPVREVRTASTPQPTNRTVQARGRGVEPVNAGGPGRRLCRGFRPLYDLIRVHVFAADRVHGDDTLVPVLAKGKTVSGRAWVYVRDDRPFGGCDPPAAVFFYSRDRSGDHERHLAGYGGVLQADAYAGFNRLYEAHRKPGPLIEAACWAHARRKFFVLADVTAKARGRLPVLAPLALEAVKRIDAIFDIEREINGLSAAERLAMRRARAAPLVAELEAWMRAERARLSRHAEVAKAMDYMLKRLPAFTRFLDDGRICLSNNAAERELRGIALGRKSWLFSGSDRGGERAALMYALIQTAKLNDVDPQGWLADVLARINEHNIQNLDQLLPWNWEAQPATLAA